MVRKANANDTSSSNASLTSATGLDQTLAANTTYTFDYYILFQSAGPTTGIALAVTGPASPAIISYTVQTPDGGAGTGGMYSGWGSAYDVAVVATAVQATATTYLARISGVIKTGATAGTLTPRFRTSRNNTAVTLEAGSWGALYTP
jgi:hypothetical protein